MSVATSVSMLPIPLIINAAHGNLPRQFDSETYKTSLQRRGVKTTMQEKENGDVDGRCVSYNTLEIATECYNALSQTPAIHGRSIFILEVLLLK